MSVLSRRSECKEASNGLFNRGRIGVGHFTRIAHYGVLLTAFVVSNCTVEVFASTERQYTVEQIDLTLPDTRPEWRKLASLDQKSLSDGLGNVDKLLPLVAPESKPVTNQEADKKRQQANHKSVFLQKLEHFLDRYGYLLVIAGNGVMGFLCGSGFFNRRRR